MGNGLRKMKHRQKYWFWPTKGNAVSQKLFLSC